MSAAEVDDIFYRSQKMQRLVIAVDFEYRVIFDEIEAKIARIFVTLDVIAVYTDMWMFFVKSDELNLRVLSILWSTFEHTLNLIR